MGNGTTIVNTVEMRSQNEYRAHAAANLCRRNARLFHLSTKFRSDDPWGAGEERAATPQSCHMQDVYHGTRHDSHHCLDGGDSTWHQERYRRWSVPSSTEGDSDRLIRLLHQPVAAAALAPTDAHWRYEVTSPTLRRVRNRR